MMSENNIYTHTHAPTRTSRFLTSPGTLPASERLAGEVWVTLSKSEQEHCKIQSDTLHFLSLSPSLPLPVLSLLFLMILNNNKKQQLLGKIA